jgi:putative membrane protein
MMWDGGYGMGAEGVIWLVVMLAVLALIVVGIVLLVRGLSGRGDYRQSSSSVMTPGPNGAGQVTPLQILELRYARGEIDREEFLQRKADLSS